MSHVPVIAPAVEERPAGPRNFYGRRHGKKLRPRQVRLLEDLLPKIAVPDPRAAGAGLIDLGALFGRQAPVWLEIGFGGGEHLAHQAAAHPQIGLIGCEPFVNGVAMLLGRLAAQDCGNVRVHVGDARDLIDALPAAALTRVFLLYPDPWPKARHHRRRFMSPENLQALARVMAPGAHLRLATDVAAYAAHACAAVRASDGFRELEADPRAPWPDWLPTRYEQKALRCGRQPLYLTFAREADLAPMDPAEPIA